MTDNQKKKLSPEQIKQREEIGVFIEKASKRNISELITEHFPKNRGTYYDNVVKIPLKLKFIELIKEKFGVDLNDFLRHKEIDSKKQSQNLLVNFTPEEVKNIILENDRLHQKLEGILEDKLEDKLELLNLMRENKALEIELKKYRK